MAQLRAALETSLVLAAAAAVSPGQLPHETAQPTWGRIAAERKMMIDAALKERTGGSARRSEELQIG